MKIAVAEIRRAGQRLRSQHKSVTVEALCRELSAPRSVIESYLQSFTEISAEMGLPRLQSHKDSAYQKYMRAVQYLDARHLIITVPRVALLSGKSKSAVHMWLRRKAPGEYRKKFISMIQVRVLRRLARAKWQIKIQQQAKEETFHDALT